MSVFYQMSRKQILTLYKTKLQLCRYMGYQCGRWNSYDVLPQRMNKRMVNRYIKKNIMGDFLWNHVRMQYKYNLYEQDPDIINDAIDDAFVALRYINYVMELYKSKHGLLTS